MNLCTFTLVTRINRQVLFLHKDERPFLGKDVALQQMDKDTDNIQSHNILHEYKRRHKYLEN